MMPIHASNKWQQPDAMTKKEWYGFDVRDRGGRRENFAHGFRTKPIAWTLKLDEIKREVPVYSKNYNSKYLQGVCDAIITYHIEIREEVEEWKMKKVYDEEQINTIIKRETIKFEAEAERIKKHNWSISNCYDKRDRAYVIDNTYDLKYDWEPVELLNHSERWVKHTPYNEINPNIGDQYRILIDFKPTLNSISGIIGQLKVYRDCIGPSDLMIITYDKNTKYDPILKEENIYILRIEEPDEEAAE